jgi:hypothetical protein
MYASTELNALYLMLVRFEKTAGGKAEIRYDEAANKVVFNHKIIHFDFAKQAYQVFENEKMTNFSNLDECFIYVTTN